MLFLVKGWCNMKYVVGLALYGVVAIVILLLVCMIGDYVNPCSRYKPDASLIQEIDKILRRDPKLSSILNNNSYTLNIIKVTAYPYTENGATKCLVVEARVGIDFNKPIHVVSHGLVTQDYWTYGLIVDVVLDNNTLVINGGEIIKIHG
jgi:hypothetical protein